jgi:hypothetical protein
MPATSSSVRMVDAPDEVFVRDIFGTQKRFGRHAAGGYGNTSRVALQWESSVGCHLSSSRPGADGGCLSQQIRSVLIGIL